MSDLAGRMQRLGSVKVFITLDGADPERFPAGSVVIPRRNAERPNVYRTIYEALRSRMEIMARYGARRQTRRSELSELGRLRDTVLETHVRIASEGDEGDAFAVLQDSLKGKSNPHKTRAREKAKAGGVRTERGKLNRGATRARLASIDDRLADREDEVRSIAPWIGAMETALLLELRRCIGVVKDLDRTAHAVLRHALCVKGRTTKRQQEAIAARFFLQQREICALKVAPFNALCPRLKDPLLAAILAARGGDGEALAKNLRAVTAITGCALARHRIEGVIALVSLAAIGERSLEAVPRAVEKVKAELRQTLPRIGAAERLKTVEGKVEEALGDLFQTDLASAKERLKTAAEQL